VFTQFLTSKPVIYMINVTKRDYLRSLPSTVAVAGRENIRVREVIDEMFAYESTGHRIGLTDRPIASPEPSVASTSTFSVGETDFKSQSTEPSLTLPALSPGQSVSIGNPNSTTIEFASESLDRYSSVVSASVSAPIEVPHNSLATDYTGSIRIEEDSLSLGTDIEPVFKASFSLKIVDDPAEGAMQAPPVRLSTVLCCCIEFEHELTTFSKEVHNDEHHHHHIHSRVNMNSHLSAYEEYMQANPSHKSVVPSILDELFKALGLIRFYTMDITESKASVWLIRRGSTTPQAASVIHTNMSRYVYYHINFFAYA
jgi:hypothetical protein